MREIHAYENKDGTFRVDISDKTEYSEDNIKQWKDVLIQIPRAKISLDILKNNDKENISYTIDLTDFEKRKEGKHDCKPTNNRSFKCSK